MTMHFGIFGNDINGFYLPSALQSMLSHLLGNVIVFSIANTYCSFTYNCFIITIRTSVYKLDTLYCIP